MRNLVSTLSSTLQGGVRRGLLFLALVASVSAIYAQSGTCGENLTWDLTDGVLTISGTGAMEDYKFALDAPWNDYRSSIHSVVITDGVTSIGDWTFIRCDFLTSINVDANNPNYCSIDGVLFNKDKTTLIQYPIGNTRSEYTILNSVTSIGWSAFSDCSSLTSITIPNSVTNIGDFAFFGCSSLTSITIPNSVKSIGDYAFYGCSSLISITIPNSVTSIGIGAFADCFSLTSVTIGNSVTSIGGGAFQGCFSLTSVTIPNSVTEIGEYAFYGCDKLVDVYCYATTPPVTKGEDTFSQYNAFLYVPCESKKAYMVNAVWGNFKYIECISLEGIENVQGNEVQSTKVVNDGQVLILRNGKTYTMQGQEVK